MKFTWGTIGITVDGACAEYVKVPARNCYRLPETVTLAHAPLIEPLSTIVRGFDLVAPKLGDHFLIYGAGTMGPLYLQVAQPAGAASVSVVDLNEDRLAVARKLGADARVRHGAGHLPAGLRSQASDRPERAAHPNVTSTGAAAAARGPGPAGTARRAAGQPSPSATTSVPASRKAPTPKSAVES
ncbi:MDR/zinc-dependent alcohol dehydrogenase-like family protein [Streptomyces decoyicus]|uniref:hypothetical protein n=1 Tax=Streptomyces decoyicus TaxID=249567 RepID=UPI003818BEBE